MVMSSLRLDEHRSPLRGQAIGEQDGDYALRSRAKISGDEDDLSSILKSLPPSYFRPSSAKASQSDSQGSPPSGGVTIESLLAELNQPTSTHRLSSDGNSPDINASRPSTPLLSYKASSFMEKILVQGQSDRLGKENSRLNTASPRRTSSLSPLPRPSSANASSRASSSNRTSSQPKEFLLKKNREKKREQLPGEALGSTERFERYFNSILPSNQTDADPKRNAKKRPGETKEKIKDQTPTQDDQGGNWHSKEPKSDGKRASDPGSSSSQKGDESMSVKDRKQKSEGGWVFRPRAYSELNNDNNKMAESSIGGSSPPLTIERAFDESQHHQKSNSKLEETPAVDRNQSQQKSRDRLEEKLVVEQSVDEKMSTPNESSTDWEKVITETLSDPEAKKQFLTRPLGVPFLIQCTVTRVKGPRTHLNSKYTLRLANSNMLIMAARKRKKSRTPYYILSSSEDEIKRDSCYSVGKLRTNYSGTEYMLYSSYGLKAVPSKQVKQPRRGMRRRTTGSDEEEEEEEYNLKREMGIIMFKQSSFTLRGGNPRKMMLVQPVPNPGTRDENCEKGVSCEFEKTWIPPKPEDSMLQVFKKAQGKKWGDVWSGLRKDLLVYKNKEPEWDEELNAFCLDFGGRVTKTSTKNCQVVALGDEGLGLAKGDIILQFGKTSGNTFSLDFRYPFCPMMAFSMALASMDDKHTNIL